jgi:protein-S-isoprenylcysteine O-methyltransferase Ste14
MKLFDIQAIFGFVAKDPIMAFIVSGVLLILVSILVMQFSTEVAAWFRNTGFLFALIGALLYIVKMLPKLAK